MAQQQLLGQAHLLFKVYSMPLPELSINGSITEEFEGNEISLWNLRVKRIRGELHP